MASERSTDVQAFIGELDGGVFETKIGAVLSEVASGVMNTKTKGKVSLNLEIEPFDENRVKIKHKLSYVRPTNRGENFRRRHHRNADVCQSRWSPDYSAGRPRTITDSCR